MQRGYVDPWAREKMTRAEAQRRYNNLVLYQLRPMLMDRRLSDEARIGVLKRIIREASRFKYESGVVAGAGTREEIVDLLTRYLKEDSPWGDELQDWVKRTIRSFGANLETEEF